MYDNMRMMLPLLGNLSSLVLAVGLFVATLQLGKRRTSP
jgi:hypothetical protein